MIKINNMEEATIGDRVLIMSTSSEHLNEKEGYIEKFHVSKYGVGLFVILDDGTNTWIDADEVILIK